MPLSFLSLVSPSSCWENSSRRAKTGNSVVVPRRPILLVSGRGSSAASAPSGRRHSPAHHKWISSWEVSFPCGSPDQSNVKRYEVIRHPMDGDFPRKRRYTSNCRVSLQAGQRLSGIDWGQGNLSQPLQYSSSIIADFLHTCAL